MTAQGSASFSGRRSGVIRHSVGLHVQLYKNNTDFHGHSYGCHDNYLVSRSIPFPSLAAGLLPFLVSRQVIAGAGKVGVEGAGERVCAGSVSALSTSRLHGDGAERRYDAQPADSEYEG